MKIENFSEKIVAHYYMWHIKSVCLSVLLFFFSEYRFMPVFAAVKCVIFYPQNELSGWALCGPAELCSTPTDPQLDQGEVQEGREWVGRGGNL